LRCTRIERVPTGYEPVVRTYTLARSNYLVLLQTKHILTLFSPLVKLFLELFNQNVYSPILATIPRSS